MSIIVFLSLSSLFISLTIVLSGRTAGDEDLFNTGMMFLCVLFIFHVAFQIGADWQRQDTLERYTIVKKLAP